MINDYDLSLLTIALHYLSDLSILKYRQMANQINLQQYTSFLNIKTIHRKYQYIIYIYCIFLAHLSYGPISIHGMQSSYCILKMPNEILYCKHKHNMPCNLLRYLLLLLSLQTSVLLINKYTYQIRSHQQDSFKRFLLLYPKVDKRCFVRYQNHDI